MRSLPVASTEHVQVQNRGKQFSASSNNHVQKPIGADYIEKSNRINTGL
jgi:hypothetical protein